jgi:hypothetical protein
VAAFPSEPVVEADAEASQLRDPGGSLGGQQLHRAGPAEAPARGERVGRVEGGVVVRPDRRGHSSLSCIAVRARVRRLCEHLHRGAGVGRCEGRGEAGDTGSDHKDVAPLAFLSHKR